MKPLRSSRILLLLGCLAWLGLVGGGLYFVWGYENSPGRSGVPPMLWPDDSAIRRNPELPTLVLFIHPHCPCSRATIGELAILMAGAQGRVHATAVFVKPAGLKGGEGTDLWTSARDIPGITMSVDENGVEAKRFRSETSGQVALYDQNGQLLFSGGITGSRGHSGDNAGRTTIQSLLANGQVPWKETPVFGCPLIKADSNKTPEEFCNAPHGN